MPHCRRLGTSWRVCFLLRLLGQCPNVTSVLEVLDYPSLFVVFSATAIASFIFVLVVAFKVRVCVGVFLAL